MTMMPLLHLLSAICLLFPIVSPAADSTQILQNGVAPSEYLLEQGEHTWSTTSSTVTTSKKCAALSEPFLLLRVKETEAIKIPMAGTTGFIINVGPPKDNGSYYTITGTAQLEPFASVTLFWQIWCLNK